MQTKKFLQGFFWFAYAAFLAASIPHVAYFFRAFEPSDMGLDWWYWGVATFIAVSIDVTVFLLSTTVAGLQRQGKAKALIASVWLFILALAALSWYMNDEYAIHFVNTSMLSATPVTLPLVNIPISDINPLIASCFQALAIAYTWIADKIAFSEQPKTAMELQQEADELEAATKQQQRIAAIKRGSNVESATALFDAGVSLVGHIKKRMRRQDEPSPQADTQPVSGDSIGGTSDEHEEADSVVSPMEDRGQATARRQRDTDKLSPAMRQRGDTRGDSKETDEEQSQEAAKRQMRSQRGANTGDSEMAKKIRRLLAKNASLSASDLAERVSCSRGYAGKIKAQVLGTKKELSA